MNIRSNAARVVTAAAVAARVAVGVLWIGEAVVKYRAGFGSADILLVANGAASNSRTPFWFGPVGALIQSAPTLMGAAIPLLEALLGITLVFGVLTRWAASASIATLMLYWASDQLIAQYPLMVLLSAIALLTPRAARFGADAWWRARQRRRGQRVESPAGSLVSRREDPHRSRGGRPAAWRASPPD